jgi:hypothetical protein
MMRYGDSRTYLMDANQYEFYSKWYYSAVRELLNTAEFVLPILLSLSAATCIASLKMGSG